MATGSLVNMVYNNSTPAVPTVGMGATRTFWTDRRAGTIVKVSASGKSVEWTDDIAVRTDEHGMSDSQSYSYTTDPDASPITFTLRKNGKWVLLGESINGGSRLIIGIRDTHFDYSF